MEDEIVIALTTVAGFAAPAGAAATLGAFDAVAANIVLVTGVHGFASTPLVVAKDRLADVTLGDMDVFALRHVAYAAAVHGTLDRLADLFFVATQKAFAIADRFVLAGEASINDLLQGAALGG